LLRIKTTAKGENMPFRKVTLKEWEALGLPTEISNIHLGNPDLVKKMKEHSEKKKKEQKIVKNK
jgi:hypothetical protein